MDMPEILTVATTRTVLGMVMMPLENVFPFSGRCDDQPNYNDEGSIPERAYVAHVAEGIDNESREEFNEFDDAGRLGSQTSIIHCVACDGPQLSQMKATGTGLIWSPQSNVSLLRSDDGHSRHVYVDDHRSWS